MTKIADWLFDETGDETEWRRLAARAGEALTAARQAVERSDEDGLLDRDRRALERALWALADVRRGLQALERSTLGDAESLVREILDRQQRPAALLVQQG